MKSTRPRSLMFVLLLLGLLLVILAASYYMLWRPSDDKYQDATAQLKSMRTASFNINQILKVMSTADIINDTLVSELNKATNQYNTSFKSLGTNVIVARDLKTKSVFDQYKNTFTSYGSSASAIVVATDRYRALIDTCTGIANTQSGSAASTFTTIANACKAAIANFKAAPSTKLKDQFQDEYATLASNLLDAYSQQTTIGATKAVSDKIRDTKTKMTNLGKKKIDLTLSDPTTAIQEPENIVNSQNIALLR